MAEKKKKEEKPQEEAPPPVEAKSEEAPAPPAGKKERPTPDVLEKLTTTKLRELALAHYPQIVGVSGMKKEELVEAIKKVEVELGLREPEKKKGDVLEAKDLKKIIKGLKVKKAEVLAAKDKTQLKTVRTKIKRLKRRIKKMKTKAA